MDKKDRIIQAISEFGAFFQKSEVAVAQTMRFDKKIPEDSKDKIISENTIRRLIKDVKETDINALSSSPEKFVALAEQALELNLDKLSATLINLQTLMENTECKEVLGQDVISSVLNNRLDEIETAINSLCAAGCFQKNLSDQKPPLDGKKILVVEDMPHNRILLKKILKKQNSEAVEAVNGEEAIRSWRELDDIDLIIMDMNMPVLDGFEATKAIRAYEIEENLERIPIIALTALAMRGDKEKCLDAGCDDYLPKPVEANALISICGNILSGDSSENGVEADSHAKLDLKPIIVKSDDNVIQLLLESLLSKLSLQCVFETDSKVIETALYNNESDLLILEAPQDLELAFHLNNNFSNKFVIPIVTENERSSVLVRDRASILHYPFDLDQIRKVLLNYAAKIRQAKKKEEQIADADSLAKIKGQVSITEAVQKSNKQLSVWQKAFRKIGGDLVVSYQFNLHGKYGFILGDVAGHDIQSGYAASWFAGLVKGVWGQNSNPFDLLRYLNNLFAHEADEEDKRFVCALVLLWDPLRRKLSYANAGIPGGILVKKDATEAIDLKWTGIPIGMFPDMDMFDHDSIAFFPGDRLYIATDGVLEAIPSEVISGIGETKANQPPQEALDSIVDFVTRSIEVTDDLTIAVFEARDLPLPENGYRESIKSDFQEVDGFIDRLDQFIQKNAPSMFDWSLISIAIREALINAVEHGNNGKAELPIDIDVEFDGTSLSLKISDCGSGFDLSTEKERLEKEGDLRIHGRGIEMMENITSEMSYTGSGVLMKFTKV